MTHLVMFDVDGTLVDSTGFDGALYARAVREVLDVEVDQTWASYRNLTDSGILDEVLARGEFGGGVEQLKSSVKRRFIELVQSYVAANPLREVPGAKALVEVLLEAPGVRVAIATGGWKETALLKLNAVGVAAADLALATASDAIERTKIMQLAERRATDGLLPSRRTYFGDGAWDKRASAELGYDFIAIGRGVAHDRRFDDFNDREAVLAFLGA